MTLRDRLRVRASALTRELGELVDDVAVVGGISPALYPLNDTVVVRPTRDIDLLIPATSYVQWARFVGRLERQGFRYARGEPICRYLKGELIVDVMPTEVRALGFGNRWYAEAWARRAPSEVAGLRVVAPIYFAATKLDAFEGRGAASPLSSHDLEDLLIVVRGLPGLLETVERGIEPVHAEVRRQLRALFAADEALDLVRAMLEGDAATQATAPELLARLRRACGAARHHPIGW